ncbi:MAG: hypothetical protein A2636_00270 [Elusimicrobia bacterium RIFCSPHIGHO2_01_FULL_64_10]|nr:MAG: hypothetical protein A2636_00270 [Elusimicrobia bacterium RIFCSPHIGHO2_01_FULL_64_10]
MKNKLRRNSLLIALAVSVLASAAYWLNAFINFENKSLDWRFRLRGVEKPKSPVVIAAIDVEALETVGKWPWRRKVHARLVDALRRAGVKGVLYDVLFYEPDRERPWEDRDFARSVRRSGAIVTAYSFEYEEIRTVETDEKGQAVTKTEPVVSKGEPLPSLVEASKAVGFVNCFPDPDGYLRRAPLVYDYEGETHYAQNILTLSVALDKPVEEILAGLPLSPAVTWGYPSQEALINYRGPEEDTFPTYSCAAILDGTIPREWLKGKIVLIGSTALGLYDHYPTPFSASFPGLYFHANVIDNLWAGDFLAPSSPFFTLFWILFFGLLAGVAVPRVTAWVGALSAGAIAAGFWTAGYFLMVKKLYYMELVAPTISLLGCYVAAFFYRFIVEQREKAGIKRAFGVYVNPHVVDQIAKNPEGLKLGGEQREMTVMFSDVAGFTTISENLSPQELVHLLNLYLTAMTDTIMKFDGTVDKYEGDAIMAFWGAPLVQPSHARQACLAVLENRDRLRQLNEELSKKGLRNLDARCGLNTGPMNVGNMGSNQKFNYTVMGDSVNLASRLEGANKQYGTNLMVSESTYAQAKDDIEVRELDLLRVKGKEKPIKVFELVCRKGGLSEAQKKGVALYDEALALYRKRDFKKALARLEAVLSVLPGDKPAETYIRRAKDYIDTPPPANWDGVFVMTTK